MSKFTKLIPSPSSDDLDSDPRAFPMSHTASAFTSPIHEKPLPYFSLGSGVEQKNLGLNLSCILTRCETLGKVKIKICVYV